MAVGFPQLGLDLWTYTATASSAVADHPASNLARILRPYMTWEAAIADAIPTIIVDLGATKLPKAVYLNNANFSQLAIEAGADGVNFTETVFVDNLAFDARVQRWKAFIDLSAGMTIARRFLRLTCFTLNAGETAFALGSLVVLGPFVTWANSWGNPIQWTPRQAATRVPFLGGGAQINKEGRLYLEYNLHGAPWRDPAMANLLELQAIEKGGPFVLYENRGNIAHAYLLQRAEDVPFSERFRVFEAPFTFEEFI